MPSNYPGALKLSRFTDEQMKYHQQLLSANVAEVNQGITELNNIPQSLTICGTVRASQLYWHHRIEKEAYKRVGDKRRVSRRISWNVTGDRVHATEGIAYKWFTTAHDNILRCCKGIQALHNLSLM